MILCTLCSPSCASGCMDLMNSKTQPLVQGGFSSRAGPTFPTNHRTVARKKKKEVSESVWEDWRLRVWGWENLSRREYPECSWPHGTFSQKSLLQAFQIKYLNSLLAAAFPLETKAHVLHLIAGTRLLINLSEQLCPNTDRLSASCLLGVSTFKIAPLPDSRVEGQGDSISFFFLPWQPLDLGTCHQSDTIMETRAPGPQKVSRCASRGSPAWWHVVKSLGSEPERHECCNPDSTIY